MTDSLMIACIAVYGMFVHIPSPNPAMTIHITQTAVEVVVVGMIRRPVPTEQMIAPASMRGHHSSTDES